MTAGYAYRGCVRSSALRFTKGHGTGNDFVLLPDPDGDLELSTGLVRAVCDRRSGVGGDGVLRVVLTAAVPEVAHLAADARWFMDYRNADGSRAEMCGNGIRVYARYLVASGYARPGRLQLATRAGIRTVELAATGDVTADLGTATVAERSVPVRVADGEYPAHRVVLGNPHAVAVVRGPLEALDLSSAPHLPAAEYPDGANVELVRELAPGTLALRVHERGAGETRSCGTGASAAVAAVRQHGSGEPQPSYRVEVPGGALAVDVTSDGRYLLSGPAVLVADGELRPEWLAAVLAGLDPDTDRDPHADRPPPPERAGAGSSSRG